PGSPLPPTWSATTPLTAPGAAPERTRRRPAARIVVPLLVTAALAAGIAVVLATRGTEPPPLPEVSTPSAAAVVPLQAVPAPQDVTGRVDGEDVVFTWRNPDPQDGDVYRWRRTDVAEVGRWQTTQDAEVRVTGVDR